MTGAVILIFLAEKAGNGLHVSGNPGSGKSIDENTAQDNAAEEGTEE